MISSETMGTIFAVRSTRLPSMPCVAHRIAGVLLGCIVVVSLATGQAVAQGSIRGSVRHAGEAIADHRIMLIRFGPNRDVQRIPGQTDAQGYFVFEQLATGEQFEYTVGIRYNGQLYRSTPVVLRQDEQRTGVILDVETNAPVPSGPESEPSMPLQMGSHHIVVVPQEGLLRIREILKILNTATTAYVGIPLPHTGQNMSLRLPLPPGHRDLGDVQGLSPEHLHYYASGLYYTAPLPPGEHRIAYTYSVPIQEATTILLTERVFPTSLLEVLVADKEMVVASDLSFAGHVSLDTHVFARFQGTNLPGTARAWIQLTVRRDASTLLKIVAYVCVTGLALAAIITSVASLRRRRSPAADSVYAARPIVEASQLRILRNIVQLDTQREAGNIDAMSYQQRRDAYKRQLYTVMQQQRAGTLSENKAVQERSL